MQRIAQFFRLQRWQAALHVVNSQVFAVNRTSENAYLNPTEQNADRHRESGKPGPGRVAWIAIRSNTLPLSLSPVLAGSVVGWIESGGFRADILIAGALAAAAIQIGTNLHNDAVDTLNGTDDDKRIGPVRATQRGWVTPAQMLRASHLVFAMALVFGSYLLALGGLPILVIGLVSVIAAYGYSSGPRPISRGPLGELVVLLFFGVIAVGGIAWLHTGQLSIEAVLVGLIVGLPASMVLLINNARDIENDRAAGRRTLAIALGRRGSIRLCAVFLVAVAVSLVLLTVQGGPWLGALAGFGGLLTAVPVWNRLDENATPEAFNASLKGTVFFQMALTAMLCGGLLLAAALGS